MLSELFPTRLNRSLQMPFIFLMIYCFLSTTSIFGQSVSIESLTDDYYAAKETYYRRDYNEAIVSFHDVLARTSQLDSVPARLMYKLHFRLGIAYVKVDNAKSAMKHLDSALVYVHQWPESQLVDEADVYLNKGVCLSKMMKLPASNAANMKALDLLKKQFGPEHEEVAGMYMHLGINYYKTEQFERAEQLLLQAKQIFEKVLDPNSENWNRIYNNMGMVYRKKKDYEKSMNFARLALQYKLKHYAPDHPSVLKYYSNLFRVCRDKGDWACAEKWNSKQLELANKIKDKYPKPYAAAQTERAELMVKQGRFDEAIQLYLSAHKIFETYLDETNPYLLSTFSNLAICHEMKGDYDGAIRHLRHAQRLRLSHDDLYLPHYFDDGIHMASLYKQKGEYKKAQSICDSMLAKLLEYEKNGLGIGFYDKYNFLRITGLHEKAQIILADKAASLADRKIAQTILADAIGITDDLHKRAYWSDYVSPVIEESYGLYELAIANEYQLAREEDDAQAGAMRLLQLIEGSKSLALRKVLARRALWRSEQVPSDLVDSINHMNRVFADFRDEFDTSIPPANRLEEIIQLAERREKATARAAEFVTASSINMSPISESEINTLQEELLRSGAARISYFIADGRGYGVYISGERLEFFGFELDDELIDDIKYADYRELPEMASNAKSTWLQEIYHRLWQPMEQWLDEEDIQRISISPSGVLQSVPFDILPMKDGEMLVDHYAISYQHSFLSEQAEIDKQDQLHYVGFAPVFEGVGYNKDLLAQRGELEELMASADEVERGVNLFRGTSFVRSQANEENFKASCSDADILHIASHAQADDSPSNSGIYFYQSTLDGMSKEDEFLSLNEIYALDLDNDLVILSACKTGEGKSSKSEGALSLARGFSYAGSKSVMMSQWRATDKSTAEIVDYFLQNIKEGQAKDVALQRAKLKYLQQADNFTTQPYFWAGLSLYGNMDPIVAADMKIVYTTLFFVGLLVFFVVYQSVAQKS